jgi:hypothetical protein
MRKLTLNLDALDVESFDASPRRADLKAGTVEAYAEAIKDTYYYRTCGACVPYTQDMAYPECVCDLSRTCPSFDAMACPVEEQPIDHA